MAAPPAAARDKAAVAFMPLSDVKPGMIGEGLTVFSGTKPESFKVEVVSVLRGFLPRQDIVLVKVQDDRVKWTGVAAGMSGSPIYINGKLLGALAYAWAFSKEALAGITPISAMLADANRPLRASPPRSGTIDPGLGGAFDGDAPEGVKLDEPRLQRMMVPLAIAGVPPMVTTGLRGAFEPLGFIPVQAAGGARGTAETPPALVPGGAVGVQLVSGDVNATATGTVTYVDGDRVLAFGHPMMGAGQVEMPMVAAEIHTILPSLASAFKIASPLGEVGTLLQDRPSCIVGKLGGHAGRIPVSVAVSRKGETPRPFRAEVARHERLTPLLISLVTSGALADAEPDPVDVVVDLRTNVVLRGMAPIELREVMRSPTGFNARALAMSRGLRGLGQLLGNPFRAVDLDRLDIEANVSFSRDVEQVVGVRVTNARVRAGETATVQITLRQFDGGERVETVRMPVPRRLAGQVVDLEVASGDQVRPFTPQPRSLEDLVTSLAAYYEPSQLVVSLRTPQAGAALRGQVIAGLPPAALDTLNPAHDSLRAETHQIFERRVLDNARLLTGKSSIKVLIEDDPLGLQSAR